MFCEAKVLLQEILGLRRAYFDYTSMNKLNYRIIPYRLSSGNPAHLTYAITVAVTASFWSYTTHVLSGQRHARLISATAILRSVIREAKLLLPRRLS